MKQKKLSASSIALIALLGTVAVSMFGYSLVKTNGYTVDVTNYQMTLTDLSEKMAENLAENGRDIDVLFTLNDTYNYSFSTFIPKNATKDHPAPVVIGCHGYNNSKEMQLANYVELAKRGFVVVTPDLAGHGYTDAEIIDYTGNTEGVIAAVNYAMTMDEVDINKIGLIGHSAGDLDAVNAMNAINVAGAKATVSSFFCPCGTISALFAGPHPGVILGVAAGKYDELDTYYFSTSHFMDSFLATLMVKNVYPGFADPVVTEGQWYTAAGPVDAPEAGQALGVDTAVAIWNPAITHVGGMFTIEATELAIDFFYAAYGTPTNAKYISSSLQTWPVAVVFQLLCLLAFFATPIVLASCLLKVKAIKELKICSREVTSNNVVVDLAAEKIDSDETNEKALDASKVDKKKELPSIKSWKEFVPIIVTFIPLILFPIFMYYPCYNAAPRLFGSTFGLPNINGIAFFTLVCGIFSIFMLFVNWIAKKLCHLKDGVQVVSPFSYAKLSGFAQFGKLALFSLLLVLLMYLPQFIAFKGTQMNFGISVYVVGLPRYEWLPEILKYLPFWLVFMFANTLLNAGARFKEIPEWGSTLFIALANLFPIVLLIVINYTHLVTTGQTYFTFGDPSIMIWNLLAPMILIAVLGRYFYKKTGNIWVGTIVCALILTTMSIAITRHTTGAMFYF